MNGLTYYANYVITQLLPYFEQVNRQPTPNCQTCFFFRDHLSDSLFCCKVLTIYSFQSNTFQVLIPRKSFRSVGNYSLLVLKFKILELINCKISFKVNRALLLQTYPHTRVPVTHVVTPMVTPVFARAYVVVSPSGRSVLEVANDILIWITLTQNIITLKGVTMLRLSVKSATAASRVSHWFI